MLQTFVLLNNLVQIEFSGFFDEWKVDEKHLFEIKTFSNMPLGHCNQNNASLLNKNNPVGNSCLKVIKFTQTFT